MAANAEAMRGRLRASVLTAFFASAAAAGGYLLMAIPNVEIFTLILFLAGYALGPGRGVTSALAASFLYFGLNPQGGLFPPLLLAQFLGAAAAPLVGALHVWSKPRGGVLVVLLALAGVTVTFWYDLLTNLAYPFSAGFGFDQIMTTLILGIPFAALHIVSNALIFALLAPPCLALIRKRRWRIE